MDFLHQYPIIIPFIAILSAELLKVVIDLIKKRPKLRFINPGGMPSGHSAFVGSLVAVVAYREGVESTLFMFAAVIALIVMYDAVTLRSAAGKHARALNKHHNMNLEESLGHNLWEVVVGAVFGAGLSFVLLVI
ncbi:divergent PAP2 family protein [Candidatus Peregrinibacteria bacterium]|nr:divergent PAP2 family protein [Candidatus Peregrinibacteria bacterium]